jgi:hypothetical protein
VKRRFGRLYTLWLVGLWFFFGASCASTPKPSPETAIRAALDIIEIICPPETTVGDCAARVKAWLPAQKSLAADAGSD